MAHIRERGALVDTREYDSIVSKLPSEMGLFQHLSAKDESKDTEAGSLEDMLVPFAFEETLCRDVGAGIIPPSLHLWSHSGGVALGLRDSKLPCAAQAMLMLEEQGLERRLGIQAGLRCLWIQGSLMFL